MSQFVQVLEHDVSPWPVATLGDGLLENVQPGFACGNHNSGGKGIVHVRPFNVTTDGRMDFSTLKFIPISEVTKPDRLLSQGDVVFNNTNSPELVGKTAFYADSEERAFSNHMTRIRVNQDKIRPEYLALALHQLWREGYFADKCNNHVSQASISRTVLLETEIALPPLSEQDRLVEALAATQEVVDQARDRLATIPALLKKFRQSVLAAACSGQLTADWRESHPDATSPIAAVATFAAKRKTRKGKVLGADADAQLPDIPHSWRYFKLPDLGELNRGKSKHRPRNAPHLLGGAYPLIQTGDVARSQGTITGFTATYSEAGLAQSRLWPTGTVCITIAANIADTAVLTFPACFPDSVVGFIADPAITFPRFVELFMRTARANLAEYAPATSQANINMAILEEVRVPLPSLEEQAEIVRRVESLFALADSIESRLTEATAQVERTTQAILAKAFRGEL